MATRARRNLGTGALIGGFVTLIQFLWNRISDIQTAQELYEQRSALVEWLQTPWIGLVPFALFGIGYLWVRYREAHPSSDEPSGVTQESSGPESPNLSAGRDIRYRHVSNSGQGSAVIGGNVAGNVIIGSPSVPNVGPRVVPVRSGKSRGQTWPGLMIINDSTEPSYGVELHGFNVGACAAALDGPAITRLAKEDGELFREIWIKDRDKSSTPDLQRIFRLNGMGRLESDTEWARAEARMTFRDAFGRWYETVYAYHFDVLSESGISLDLIRTGPVQSGVQQHNDRTTLSQQQCKELARLIEDYNVAINQATKDRFSLEARRKLKPTIRRIAGWLDINIGPVQASSFEHGSPVGHVFTAVPEHRMHHWQVAAGRVEYLKDLASRLCPGRLR